MRRTPIGVRRIRYRMDTTLILLLLLFASDPSRRDALKNFLGFYRENRDLIRTFCERTPPAPSEGQDAVQNEVQKNSPEGSGDANILEAYLARMMG